MKLLTALCVCSLFLPSGAIAQINRTIGNKVSNLGNIAARTNREASRLCSKRGGNIVVKQADRWYTCYYAQQLANNK